MSGRDRGGRGGYTCQVYWKIYIADERPDCDEQVRNQLVFMPFQVSNQEAGPLLRAGSLSSSHTAVRTTNKGFRAPWM